MRRAREEGHASYPGRSVHLSRCAGLRPLESDPRDGQKLFTNDNGSVTRWYNVERPNVIMENGHVAYFTFAVSDVYKMGISGSSNNDTKVIVVPFDGVRFDQETGIGGTDGGIGPAGGTLAGGGSGKGGTDTGGSASGGRASGGRATGGAISTAGGTAISGGVMSVGGTGGGSPEQDCNCRTGPSHEGFGELFGLVGFCLLALRRRGR